MWSYLENTENVYLKKWNVCLLQKEEIFLEEQILTAL